MAISWRASPGSMTQRFRWEPPGVRTCVPPVRTSHPLERTPWGLRGLPLTVEQKIEALEALQEEITERIQIGPRTGPETSGLEPGAGSGHGEDSAVLLWPSSGSVLVGDHPRAPGLSPGDLERPGVHGGLSGEGYRGNLPAITVTAVDSTEEAAAAVGEFGIRGDGGPPQPRGKDGNPPVRFGPSAVRGRRVSVSGLRTEGTGWPGGFECTGKTVGPLGELWFFGGVGGRHGIGSSPHAPLHPARVRDTGWPSPASTLSQ